MATKIQLRRGTATQWTSANPTLSSGELGIETDSGKVKIGDGATAWASLAYFGNLEELNNVGDVAITSAATGEVLQYDGTNWVNSGISINEVSDVVITSAAVNEILQYDGSNWVNAPIDALPDQSGNAGKYLTTDGTDASWETITTDPNPQIFMLMGV